MIPGMKLLALFALLASPAFAQRHGEAVLVVAEDGALEASAVRAIRTIAASELRKRGISLLDDRRAQGVRPVDSSLAALSTDLGANRIFAIRILTAVCLIADRINGAHNALHLPFFRP